MKQEKLIIHIIIYFVLGIIFLYPTKDVYSDSFFSNLPQPPPGAEILATSPPVSVGSGARAQGMGSAFIAVADDATAASWNPGGLGQLQKPEISVVGSYFSRSETYDRVANQGSCGISSLDVNYLSIAHAKNIWRRNVFFSLNYQKMFDFGRKVVDLDHFIINEDAKIESINFQQEGSLYTFSPAMALEFKPGLYFGFTYNIWSDHITGKSQWAGKVKNINMENGFYTKTNYNYKNFRGDNYTLGFLWRVTPRINLGGVYKKSFRANVIYEYNFRNGGQEEENWVEKLIGEDKKGYEINFPTAYGVGLSFRIGNAWIMAGDITRTEWQDYKIFDSSNGKAVGPFGQYICYPNETIAYFYVPKINSTYTIRLGVEYARIMDKIVIPFRFGLFYDPEPSVGTPQDYYGGSLGFGIVLKKRLALDFAYQYRFADKVNGNELGIPGTTAKIRQHSLLSSLIFYF